MAQQLTTANERLKTLDRLKADFITTVTHELRTPVTSIRSLSKIILDYSDEIQPEKRLEYLQILVSESDRISRLINQVLDIEKIQSDTAPMKQEIIDMRQLVKDSIWGMGRLFAEKNITLVEKLGDEATFWVNGDRDRLVQVVVNLLTNALKFCDPEQGRVEVKLAVTQPGWISLRVKDNGRGIEVSGARAHF